MDISCKGANLNTLYILKGSLFSMEAERLLRESGVEFKAIHIEEGYLVDTTDFYPLFIHNLPTLITENQQFEGLHEIKIFLAGLT